MLLYQFCRLYLEFLSSLSSIILGGLVATLILIAIFIDGDIAKGLLLILLGAPIIFSLFGMFANFLLKQGLWMIAGCIIFGIMDIGIIVLLICGIMWLINEIRS